MANQLHTPYITQQGNVSRITLNVPTLDNKHKTILSYLVNSGWTIKKATHPINSKKDNLLAYDASVLVIIAERPYKSRVLYVKKSRPHIKERRPLL